MVFRAKKLPLALMFLALTLSACADDPTQPLLPDDAELARSGKAAPPPVTVMSRNLYLGADFGLVLSGQTALAFQQVQRTDFRLRVAELAEEIVVRQPDVVGLQEVSLYRIYADLGGGYTQIDEIDFLGLLVATLSAMGLDYEPLYAPNLTAPIEFTPPGGYPLKIVYTDADALLVRKADPVQLDGYGAWHFAPENQVLLPFGANLRGYQWADVSVHGQRFHFINTHLEVQYPAAWGATQERQTAEILDFVDGLDGPVIMVGDFNSAANPDAPDVSRTATYSMILDAGFDDLWLRHHGRFTTEGLTCCHLANLSNTEPDLDQRIDFVFARNVPSGAGYAGGVEMEVVGEESGDVFTSLLGYDLWPSDHAGLYAKLWMPQGLMARR